MPVSKAAVTVAAKQETTAGDDAGDDGGSDAADSGG